MGGGSVGVIGEFNFVVFEVYLVENGKLIKFFKGVMLIGMVMEIMNKIFMFF